MNLEDKAEEAREKREKSLVTRIITRSVSAFIGVTASAIAFYYHPYASAGGAFFGFMGGGINSPLTRRVKIEGNDDSPYTEGSFIGGMIGGIVGASLIKEYGFPITPEPNGQEIAFPVILLGSMATGFIGGYIGNKLAGIGHVPLSKEEKIIRKRREVLKYIIARERIKEVILSKNFPVESYDIERLLEVEAEERSGLFRCGSLYENGSKLYREISQERKRRIDLRGRKVPSDGQKKEVASCVSRYPNPEPPIDCGDDPFMIGYTTTM